MWHCRRSPNRRDIVDFLNRETVKIDALIGKQGNSSPPCARTAPPPSPTPSPRASTVEGLMKESGLEWIGEIPAHWTGNTVRTLVPVDYPIGPHFPRRRTSMMGSMFLSARNIKVVRLVPRRREVYFRGRLQGVLAARGTLKVGDVLYTKGGTTGIARAVDLTSTIPKYGFHRCLVLKAPL